MRIFKCIGLEESCLIWNHAYTIGNEYSVAEPVSNAISNGVLYLHSDHSSQYYVNADQFEEVINPKQENDEE